MYYFKQTEQRVEKYEISYEREVIEKFRTKVIKNCSLIFHRDTFSSEGPNNYDNLKIINFHKGEKVGTRSHDYAPDEHIYHFSYDEYEYPYLVELIDRLLIGDTSSLDEIFNPNLEKENPSFEELIQNASDELDGIDNLNIHEKRKKLSELESLMKVSEINKMQKPVIDYYYDLQRLITIKLIDTITIDEILSIESFFDKKISLLEINQGDNAHKKRTLKDK